MRRGTVLNSVFLLIILFSLHIFLGVLGSNPYASFSTCKFYADRNFLSLRIVSALKNAICFQCAIEATHDAINGESQNLRTVMAIRLLGRRRQDNDIGWLT